MTKDQYLKISDYVNRHCLLKRAILSLNIILTGIGFAAYPAFLLSFLLAECNSSASSQIAKGLALYIIGPAISFLLVTLYRRKKDCKRPYEYHNIQPLIEKDKKGQSFPSRHVFSFSMIAVLWYAFCRPVGIILLLLSCLLGLIRVVGGVHFIKDVAAGTLIGILAGTMINIIFMSLLLH